MRFLVKPIVCLLVVGLIGCTSTRWTAVEPSASQDPIPLIRVTLVSGEQYEVYDAIISDEGITGVRGKDSRAVRARRSDRVLITGEPFRFSADMIQSVEVGEQRISAGKTIGLVLLASVAVVGLASAIALQSLSIGQEKP